MTFLFTPRSISSSHGDECVPDGSAGEVELFAENLASVTTRHPNLEADVGAGGYLEGGEGVLRAAVGVGGDVDVVNAVDGRAGH